LGCETSMQFFQALVGQVRIPQKTSCHMLH
jgi:hypothetical protein